MRRDLDDFRQWIENRATEDRHFSGTFWFVISPLAEQDLARTLSLQDSQVLGVPWADSATRVSITRRSGRPVETTFWHVPFRKHKLHLFFSLEKPWQALRHMYKLLSRAEGKAHLFPIGHRLAKTCVRVNPRMSFDQTYVVRGVSYPSQPNEGGADINLRPGNAAVFFARLEEERRVLKLARMRAPTGESRFCEFTISRVGYLTYHRGDFAPFLELITQNLSDQMVESAKPFEEAKGQFVSLSFPEPVFADQASYGNVLQALAQLPRTTLAVLHANPYFHATLTNYEDGGEFDVFITKTSTIHIQGRGEASPASFLRLHNNLAELFRDAEVSLERPAKFRLRDLLEGRV